MSKCIPIKCTNFLESESIVNNDENLEKSQDVPVITIFKTPKKMSKSQEILGKVRTVKRRNFTPNCKKIFFEVKKLKQTVERLGANKHNNTKCRLQLAKQFTKSPLHNKLVGKINSKTLNFLMSYVNIKERKLQGRRYNLKEKMMALSIYKTSPKCYKFISSLFALPSIKTLSNLLHKIPFHSGINQHIIDNLKLQSQKLRKFGKNCTLLFHEMALDATVKYDKKNASIFGFENFQNCSFPKFADRVLVFMLRGLRKQFKQPIAYYFCQGTTQSQNLVIYIKEIITAIQDTGLNIRATVCNHGSTNQAAINILKEERRRYCINQSIEDKYDGFLINNKEIIAIFDPPHLLKCIRNHLLNKNLQFEYKGCIEHASWDDIANFYNFDLKNKIRGFSTIQKITEAHIIPKKNEKKRVSIAAQIFSQSVGSIMLLEAKTPDDELSISKGTPNLCLFMNNVFDSVNGSTIKAIDWRYLKCAIKDTSPHITFWQESIKVFESMVYVDKINGSKTKPACIKNWANTLKSFIYLWQKLKKEKFQFLILRNINLDSLECLFSSIRSHAIRNNMPNCYQFLSSFKTLLINNFTSLKSIGNCELDKNTTALDNLNKFLIGPVSERNINIDFDTYNMDILLVNSSIGEMTLGYVAGYIIRKIMNLTKNCKFCKTDCIDCDNSNDLINAKCYSSKSLYRPNKHFNNILEKNLIILTKTINNLCNKSYILMKMKSLIDKNIDFLFSCKIHNLQDILTKQVITFFLFVWCKNLNRILTCVVSQTDNDNLKTMARKYYIVHNTRKQGYNK